MPLLRRGGRPGLLGTMARTAVIAGTAQAVTGAVAGRQRSRQQEAQEQLYAQQQQEQAQLQAEVQAQLNAQAVAPVAAPATAPAAAGVDVLSKLQQLGEMRQQGLLSQEEFEQAKRQVLGL